MAFLLIFLSIVVYAVFDFFVSGYLSRTFPVNDPHLAHPDMPINLSSELPHLRREAVKSSQRHAGEQMRGGITAC